MRSSRDVDTFESDPQPFYEEPRALYGEEQSARCQSSWIEWRRSRSATGQPQSIGDEQRDGPHSFGRARQGQKEENPSYRFRFGEQHSCTFRAGNAEGARWSVEWWEHWRRRRGVVQSRFGRVEGLFTGRGRAWDGKQGAERVEYVLPERW